MKVLDAERPAVRLPEVLDQLAERRPARTAEARAVDHPPHVGVGEAELGGVE